MTHTSNLPAQWAEVQMWSPRTRLHSAFQGARPTEWNLVSNKQEHIRIFSKLRSPKITYTCLFLDSTHNFLQFRSWLLRDHNFFLVKIYFWNVLTKNVNYSMRHLKFAYGNHFKKKVYQNFTFCTRNLCKFCQLWFSKSGKRFIFIIIMCFLILINVDFLVLVMFCSTMFLPKFDQFFFL